MWSIGLWMKAPLAPRIVEQPVLARRPVVRLVAARQRSPPIEPPAPAHRPRVSTTPIHRPRAFRAALRRIRAQLPLEVERALAELRPKCTCMQRHESIA